MGEGRGMSGKGRRMRCKECGEWGGAQSRQSAKLFYIRRNWDFPTPSPVGECFPPSFGSGGRGGGIWTDLERD
jgi:hypothetical protein